MSENETEWVDAEARRHIFTGGVLGGIIDRERLEKQVEQLKAEAELLRRHIAEQDQAFKEKEGELSRWIYSFIDVERERDEERAEVARLRAELAARPDVTRLLAAAKEAEGTFIGLYGPREDMPDDYRCARIMDRLRAAIAEHEVAQRRTTAEGSRDWVPAECRPGPSTERMVERLFAYCGKVRHNPSLGRFPFEIYGGEALRIVAEHEAMKGAGG